MTLKAIETRLQRIEARLDALSSGDEYDSVVAAIKEGLAQKERGEGIPLDEAMKRIRASVRKKRPAKAKP